MKQHFEKPTGLYLQSHSLGLLPSTSRKALESIYFKPWQDAKGDTWEPWLDALEKFSTSVARLINGKASQISPQVNVSSALTKVLGALKKPGVILMSEEEFPTVGFVAQACVSSPKEVRFIPAEAELLDIDLWSQQLEGQVDTLIISHVQSNTGIKLPVKKICALAKEKGIFVIVDVAQSAGVCEVDCETWGADAIVGTSLKWLCGGPGAAFLWVDEQYNSRLRPKDVGWFSHQDPYEFDIKHFTLASDGRMFSGGTPSIAPFILASCGIETLLSIGMPKILSHNARCKSILQSAIGQQYCYSPESLEHQGGTLVIKPNESIEKILKQQHVTYDTRKYGMRLSPHIYNTEEEVLALGEALEMQSANNGRR